jgi:hypothetical protein
MRRIGLIRFSAKVVSWVAALLGSDDLGRSSLQAKIEIGYDRYPVFLELSAPRIKARERMGKRASTTQSGGGWKRV